MAVKRDIKVSVRLIRGGRFTPLNRIRYADSYEIWQGGKRIGARKKFPAFIKKAAERRDFLSDLIAEITRKVEARLERQAEAKRKRDEQRRLKRRERERVRRAELELKESDEEDRPIIEMSRHVRKNERLDFVRAYNEEPQTLKQATIQDVTIIPIKPRGKFYTKRLVEKIITQDHFAKRLDLSILDFDLDQEEWIPTDIDTLTESFDQAFTLMIPHIAQFWSETYQEADAYILRLKFQWEFTPGKYDSHGVSLRRQDIRTFDRLRAVFRETFRKLLGGNKNEPNKKPRNYLANQTVIFISGFTLEASTLI